MDKHFVYLDFVKVYDNKIFTHERADAWFDHMLNCYEDILHEFQNKLTSDTFVRFFISKALLDEVIYDAIIGMRKITDSDFNSIEDPNSFKIIAYLSYWWLRHKPVSLHYSEDNSLDDIQIVRASELTDSEYDYERQKTIWQLKHINEIVAVQMVATYIFDFKKVLCNDKKCEEIKKIEGEKFCFNSYDEMQEVILGKLTYYFSYRTIAPKVIEHILEGYTFHPAWGLTGAQWAAAKKEAVIL